MRIHPWLDDIAYAIVVDGFETVDCESGTVNAKLYPSKEQLWGRLWAFKSADVVAIALKKAHACRQRDSIGTAHTVPTGDIVSRP
jgi:hypothetical protein